jgi:uncharacterized protein (TIGR00661 family)
MNFSKINELSKNLKILVAPLDWGLGHASRCIPLIKELSANGFQVFVAADGTVKSLLQQEFPALTYISLPGYDIYYSRNRFWLPMTIALQIPKILICIYKEHQWLKKIVKEHGIDAVISDNRFGLYHSSVTCIYITHQLQIKTGSRFLEMLLRKIHYWVIKKFKECWVPDNEGEVNAAGKLSHPAHIPSNVYYIGCISRFEIQQEVSKKYDLIVILSGPEPQRTAFEELLAGQLKDFKGAALFVRGLPGTCSNSSFDNAKNIVVKNHCAAAELNAAIAQSKMIISRSGYTTVMDLIKLRQKAILVPTPGQTEQEYLARYLHGRKLFFTMPQKNFSLAAALSGSSAFPFSIPLMDMEQYKKHISRLVQSL